MSRAGSAAPLLVLGLAVLAMSHGAIFARLAGEAAPLAIAAWRLGLATLVVGAAALAAGGLRAGPRRAELAAALAGVLLAAHFAAWITSLSHTGVAQSVVLVTTSPVWVALIGRALGLVRVPPAGWLAIGTCLAGAVVVAGPGLDGGSWLGNGLALLGAVAFAGYLLAAREAQRGLDFLGFVARAYGIGAGVLAVAVLATGTPVGGYAAPTWAALVALALVSQVLGHGGANWSLRHLPPSLVAAAVVAEPVLAAASAWWLFGEAPTARTWAGGALVLGGLVLATFTLLDGGPRRASATPSAP